MPYAAARGLAWLIGGFGVFNTFIDLAWPGFDANIWWIDTRQLPLGGWLVAGLSIGLLHPKCRRPAGVILIVITLSNCIVFWKLAGAGVIRPGWPLPWSLVITAALLVIVIWSKSDRRPGARSMAGSAVIAGAGAAVFTLGLMFFYGQTSYQRSADAILVFGARTYSDGRPSQALHDRVKTACDLYQSGYAPILIMSGGPGDGAVHETDAMRSLAISLGVPEGAILIDGQGVNTRSTILNSQQLLADRQMDRILAVSHFYHLARIKMACDRVGLEAYTVPAQTPSTLVKLPWFMIREMAAFWFYYLSPPTSNTTA